MRKYFWLLSQNNHFILFYFILLGENTRMRTGLRMRRSNPAQPEFRVPIRHSQTDNSTRRQQLNEADGRK